MSEPERADDGLQPETATAVPPVPGPPPGREDEEPDDLWANPAVMDPG
jgi:hypothetical protein